MLTKYVRGYVLWVARGEPGMCEHGGAEQREERCMLGVRPLPVSSVWPGKLVRATTPEVIRDTYGIFQTGFVLFFSQKRSAEFNKSFISIAEFTQRRVVRKACWACVTAVNRLSPRQQRCRDNEARCPGFKLPPRPFSFRLNGLSGCRLLRHGVEEVADLSRTPLLTRTHGARTSVSTAMTRLGFAGDGNLAQRLRSKSSNSCVEEGEEEGKTVTQVYSHGHLNQVLTLFFTFCPPPCSSLAALAASSQAARNNTDGASVKHTRCESCERANGSVQ